MDTDAASPFVRTEADRQAAEAELRERGGDVLTIQCDVSDAGQLQAMVDQSRTAIRQYEVLFNVAEVI